jgi:hypothetical protein
MLQPTDHATRLFVLSYGSPIAQALLESHLRREPHGLCDGSHLLVAGVLYPALTKVGYVGAGHDPTRGLVEFGAVPFATVRMAVRVQEALKLLGYVYRIYDTRRPAV